LDLDERINQLLSQCEQTLKGIASHQDLEDIKVQFLGRKGLIRDLFSQLSQLSDSEKKHYGESINKLKMEIESKINQKGESIQSKIQTSPENQVFDYSLPGFPYSIGKKHPFTLICEELYQIFRSMNFMVVEDREIEDEYHNFDALNIPKWHPSRKLNDTFFLSDGSVLRTHTSPVEIRTMEKISPPIRMVTIGGRCYRRDASDATHSAVFHQIEGLVVDENINFCHLSEILSEMMRGVFGKPVEVRFVPSYFPFVEPGAETLISCPFCKGDGCSVCKNSGWIELGGSGMTHPQVLRNVNIDPTKYQGFAFGWGVERLAMIKYGIDDIRLFFENNLSFLEQF
jgi:phenylalanyl-tRNA synthetase alpha chain